MTPGFESVHNYHEEAVFETVLERARQHPVLADSNELLADVACIALNHLPARYIRNRVDMSFFLDSAERAHNEAAVLAAVDQAIVLVRARLVAGTRK